VIGTPRVHHRVAGSTNELAKELAALGAPHGTVVTARVQTAGRGRQGREWVAPPGSALLMSLVVRERDERFPLLPLAAAVAVADACDTLAPVRCQIKWPNDVWIDRRKVSGILVEGRPAEGWAVLGIGLNVRTREFPDALRGLATSLRLTGGGEVDVEGALTALIAALERRLGEPPGAILAAWRERDALRGEQVRWADGEGVAAGIDDSGSLLVETAGGVVALGAGEVHLGR
jgi:BirA family biotin operon repressor/biotin-[acetyl-CoA-carboxylase] ligase